MADTLPSFNACEAAVQAGTATLLQRFIFDNEPAGSVAESEFRAGLAALLAEARAGG
jgi:hypothetical protein